MAIHKILFASLLVCLLIQSNHGATKERLFSELEKGAIEVTAIPSRDNVVLEAGVDKVTVTWKVSSTATKEPEFKTIKVKLCYAPVSQVDRPWRKTHDELFKDKSCPHKIIAKPYDSTVKTAQTINYTLERDIPTGTYFVRVYAVDALNHEVAFGQSTDEAKKTNLFSVQAISGRHKSLDIASICFSVFSVLALLVFFVNEKRKAKLEQSK
ncbi:unnamed protein product [Thlaspi arvense]|uniref:High-affinity nitrate transporter n=1 Tax=Thlaspi arvense TaxID=13288 RepID=A0AAU9SUL0_THLAR|nr:unnamed protein product [Thlaspi arvense]